MEQESEKYGLYLNLGKTKVMTTGNMDEFIINGEKIEQVESFIFLGSNVNKVADCGQEIQRRLTLGRTAMTNLTKIWKCRDVRLTTKRRIVQTLVFPVVLYGCESWTVRKVERKKIDAFELWCWRRMLRIPWTDKITNKDVLQRVGPVMSLEAMFLQQKLRYFGHVMRHEGMEKTIMLGMVEGVRKRGRQRMRFLDGIKEVTGMNLEKLKEKTQDRIGWRTFVRRVTKSRTGLNG